MRPRTDGGDPLNPLDRRPVAEDRVVRPPVGPDNPERFLGDVEASCLESVAVGVRNAVRPALARRPELLDQRVGGAADIGGGKVGLDQGPDPYFCSFHLLRMGSEQLRSLIRRHSQPGPHGFGDARFDQRHELLDAQRRRAAGRVVDKAAEPAIDMFPVGGSAYTAMRDDLPDFVAQVPHHCRRGLDGAAVRAQAGVTKVLGELINDP